MATEFTSNEVVCEEARVKGWPAGVVEIKYPSKADDTDQPALFYKPETDEAVPLLALRISRSRNLLRSKGFGAGVQNS